MGTRLRVVSAVVVVLALAAACSSDSWQADTASPESSTTPLPTTGLEAGFSNPVEVPGPVGPSVPSPRSGTPAAQPQPTDAPTEGPEPTALPRPEPEPQPDLNQTDNNFTAQRPDPADQQTSRPADQQTSIISAGRGHSCGIRADRAVVCWGSGWRGDFPLASYDANFTAVSAGGWQSCGIRTGRTITCWGRNPDGETDALSGEFGS